MSDIIMQGERVMPSHDTGHVFWLDGARSGRGGYWVRAVALNEVVPWWIAEGIRVAGIRLHPDNGSNVDVLIEYTEPHAITPESQ